MLSDDIEHKIKTLEDKIRYYDKKYFEESKSLISDYAYDCLVQELNDLYDKYPQYKPSLSQTDIVGTDLTDGFPKVTHDIPMLSLKKTYSHEEVEKFFNDTEKLIGHNVSYICELKLDGISVDIKFKNGRVNIISTRGNGVIGDDITCNKDLFINLPENIEISADVEVRGEALMTFEDFNTLNELLKKSRQEVLANPRNATAGALKSLPKERSIQRRITLFLYNICNTDISTQEEVLQKLQQLRLPVCDGFRLCKTKEDVFEYIEYWETHRKDLPFPTDGIVIKVNELEYYSLLGATNKNPRWAIAYKYKPSAVSTKLINVEYQVGRSGIITPVAIFEHVELAGTTVSRATLNNEKAMIDMDLRYGDRVLVKKSGEIIPQIIGVDINGRNIDAQNIEFIKQCPSCGDTLQKINDLSYCLNNSCPAKVIEAITHFVSKEALNIKSLGQKTIALLVSRGLVKAPIDIFFLKYRDVYRLPGFNDRSTQKLFDECQKAKTTPFTNVLFALGIPHVGLAIARNIVNKFENIDNIISAKPEELIQTPLVGQEVANSIEMFFKNDDNLNVIKQLKQLGFNMSNNSEQ